MCLGPPYERLVASRVTLQSLSGGAHTLADLVVAPTLVEDIRFRVEGLGSDSGFGF